MSQIFIPENDPILNEVLAASVFSFGNFTEVIPALSKK